jgi:hypothetical protein
MNSRWPGEILQNVEDGVEMMDDKLGRRQEEGDQEDDKIREDLLYQEPLTPAANIQYVSLIASAAVLRIHDILVWIRVRIRGSMPLKNGSGFGSGSGSFYFYHWPSRCQQKLIGFKKFFCILLFVGSFTSFFQDEKLKRSHKTVEIKVFLTIFA